MSGKQPQRKGQARRVLICFPAGSECADGVAERVCGGCSEKIAVTERGLQQLAGDPELRLLCVACGAKLICGPRPVVIALPEAVHNAMLERIRKASRASRN